MCFFPRMKFQIESGRRPEEVRALLQSVTDTESKWFARPQDKAFVGKVGEMDFKIVPQLGKVVLLGTTMQMKDSFLPVIVGRIRTEGSGTVVDVKMRLIWPVLGFMVVWFSIPVFAFLIGLLAMIARSPDGWKMVAAMGGFILFGQALVRCGFYYPAKKARRRLEELLGDM